MKYMAVFFVTFFMLCATATSYAQRSMSSSPSPFVATLHVGYPFSLPSNFTIPIMNQEILRTGFTGGAQLLYGTTYFFGLAFDYFQLHESEQIYTTEESPEPKGTFTPKVFGQFYSVVVGYHPFAGRKVAPIIFGKLGAVARQHSLCLDVTEYDTKTKDSARFSYSFNFGAQIQLSRKLALLPHFCYFQTPEKVNGDWEATFNSAREYISANVGIAYTF